jgi:hypothetical protein
MPSGAAPSLLRDKLLAQIRLTQALYALARLHPLAQRRFRSLNYSGFFLCLSGLLSVWGVTELGAPDVADMVALRLLAYACWLYGGLGLWALLQPGAFEENGLAALRGIKLPTSLPVFVTLTTQLARGVSLSALPAMVLAVVCSEDPHLRSLRFVQLLLCVPYILAFALSVAFMGAASLALTPKFAHVTALVLLLVPFFLEVSGLFVPNVISGLVWGFGHLLAWGGA